MAACVSARASDKFAVAAAGVWTRASGVFCEKPWEWAMNRLQPNPANAMPATRRLRAMTRMISRTLDSANLYRDPVGIAKTQDISTGGRQHRNADRAQFAGHALAVE